MDAIKCRSDGRLMAALVLVELRAPSPGRVLRVWCEDTWDPWMTKDVVLEEVCAYRRSPAKYLQAQIVLR